MTTIRRFRAVCAILGLTAVLTYSNVWGEPDRKPRLNPIPSGSKTTPETTEQDLAGAKFKNGGVVTYRTTDNQVLFALGVKPQLDPIPARPRDYLVLVDTSASQFGGPLATAEKITEELVGRAKADDRIAVWTVNIPKATRDLTHGFQSPRSKEVQDALKELRNEVPLGDTDLQGGLERAVKAFGGEANRQRVLLFLGDGMSIHNPITAADRAPAVRQHGQERDRRLPGAAGTATRLAEPPRTGQRHRRPAGSRCCRRISSRTFSSGWKRPWQRRSCIPPRSNCLRNEVTDFFPTRLPPLRPDAGTLVIGHFKPG